MNRQSQPPFVPEEFAVNVKDYQAWTSSMEHIHATPGYQDGSWPKPMTLEDTRRDLERHAADFAAGAGFT